MQTFIPYPDYELSAKALDGNRLHKQVVEAKQIISTIEHGGAWSNHPTVLMWENNLLSLKDYFNAILREAISRGYAYKDYTLYNIRSTSYPWWFNVDILHDSHKSNLKRKDPSYYTFDIEDNWVYLWPISFNTFRVITPSWWKKLPKEDRPELYIPSSKFYKII